MLLAGKQCRLDEDVTLTQVNATFTRVFSSRTEVCPMPPTRDQPRRTCWFGWFRGEGSAFWSTAPSIQTVSRMVDKQRRTI